MDDLITPPMNFTFGQDFNYGMWNSNTILTLTNVNWDNNARDGVVWPRPPSAKLPKGQTLNEYIDAQMTTNAKIDKVSRADLNEPVKINIPINRASLFNYIRASNPVQPGVNDIQVDYYYFIIGVRHIASHTTELTLQIDLWATYGESVNFGNCYVERGHVGIANSKAFDNYGRDYLTKPEGLDTGGEYVTRAYKRERVMTPSLSYGYDVLVASVVDLEADGGNLITGPKLVTASGGVFSGLPAGASYYIFKSGTALSYWLADNADKPWVTQGIISITVIPEITRYIPDFEYAVDRNLTKAPPGIPSTLTHKMAVNWRAGSNGGLASDLVSTRYAHLKKFFVYPYMVIDMTTWTGTPVTLKPESWNDPDATVIERAALVPPNQRVIFAPQNYNTVGPPRIENRPAANTGDPDPGDGDDGGEYLNIATMIANFPTMALVNNAAIGYMASNFNSNSFATQSADWSQQKAQAGIATSYDQATSGQQLTADNSNLANNTSAAQNAIANQSARNHLGLNAVQSIGQGLANGGVGVIGGVASAAANAASTSMDIATRNASTSLSMGANTQGTQNTLDNAAYMRDTTRDLADFAARGDYQNTIAGNNAKIQDTKMTQPSVSGQVGGEAMNLIHGTVELSVRFKTIDRSAQTSIGEYWLRYGYAVEQFAKVSQLMVMTKFTYWKLKETYIKTAPMPESYRQALRGMFEKGFTLWVDPDDIGQIDLADNLPLEGITL